MRINRSDDSDSNFIYFAPSEKRVKRFRKKHAVGDVINGKILKYYSQRQAMIQVEEQRLMALLKTNPPVGEEVSLEVKQLHPHIVLKEISKFNELNTYI